MAKHEEPTYVTETVEQFIARGGVIKPWTEPEADPNRVTPTWGQQLFVNRKKRGRPKKLPEQNEVVDPVL